MGVRMRPDHRQQVAAMISSGRGFVLGREMRIVLGRERLIVLVLCCACIRDHRNGISGEKGRRS